MGFVGGGDHPRFARPEPRSLTCRYFYLTPRPVQRVAGCAGEISAGKICKCHQQERDPVCAGLAPTYGGAMEEKD